MTNHIYLLSSIQKAAKQGSKVLVVKKLTDHSTLLHKLSELGIIKSFKQSKSLISLSLGEVPPLKLRFKKAANKPPSFKLHNTVLQTDQGLLTGLEAAKRQVGGKLVIQLY